MTDYGNFNNVQGSLNKNSKKTNPKAPDYLGSITLDEEAIRYLVAEIKGGNDMPKLKLSGWLQEGQYGKFISMKASKPMAPNQAFERRPVPGVRAPVKQAPASDFDDSEIPF